MQMQTRTPTDEEPQEAANDRPHLYRREREILALVAEGKTDNQIAIQLCLSAKTVSWYVRAIRIRLGAYSRTHAVALALQQGLLPGASLPEQEP
jgi:DNA-binding NarL/FixJ family response regulator